MQPTWQALTAPLPFAAEHLPLLLVLGIPLLGAALLLAVGHRLPRQGSALALGGMLSAFLASLWLLATVWGEPPLHLRGHWVELESAWFERLPLRLTMGLRADALAALMTALVTGIGTLVHLFSLSYMAGEKHLHRYWGYLALFTLAMLLIVLADNLLLIYVGWELVGFSSYLLIGFWFHRLAPARASQKAFLVNRIGDLGFLIGMMLLLSQAGTLDLAALQALAQNWTLDGGLWQATLPLAGGGVVTRELSAGWLTATGILLFGGAIGKSAQFPLQIWLPDAMEGPTPVSSLIHAATMVAAGVYLMARVFFLLDDTALTYIALTGTLTALMAALAAMTQWDIKRVLAYSTISQLGYMVMALGVGARDMALLHLFTHAFFKCALFLSAGAVIHQLHHARPSLDAQDLRLMGGLRQSMPQTFGLYLLPMLALAGLPLTSGFLSKDGILVAAWAWAEAHGGLAWLVPLSGLLTAGLTAFYMARHAWLIWGGSPRSEGGHAPQESDWRMRLPLAVLALGSLWVVFSLHPLEASHSWLVASWREFASPDSEAAHLWVPLLSGLLALGGLGLGSWRYRQGQAEQPPRWLQEHFFQDEAYARAFAQPLWWLSRALAWWDRRVVDGLVNLLGEAVVHRRRVFLLPGLAGMSASFDLHVIDGLVNGLVGLIASGGKLLRKVQSGRLQQHLAFALIGVLLMIGIWLGMG